MEEFFPHRASDLQERIRHIENHLSNNSVRARGTAISSVGSTLTGMPGPVGTGSTGTVSLTDALVVQPTSATRNIVTVTSAANIPLGAQITDAGGGGDVPALRPTLHQLIHHTVAATVPGVGAGIDWLVPNDTGVDVPIASLVGEITQVSTGTEEGTLALVVMHQGQRTEVARARGQTGMAATAGNGVFGYVGGQWYVKGNMLVEGTGGTTGSITDAGTTNTVIPLVIQHLTSGTAAAGLGVEMDFVNQNGTGGLAVTGWLQSLYTGTGGGGDNGSLILGGIYGGARCEVARFRATGMAVVGGVGGQFFCKGDFLHAGTSLGFFNATPVGQQAGASAAGVAAITDAAAKAAITALQGALAAYGAVTSPA